MKPLAIAGWTRTCEGHYTEGTRVMTSDNLWNAEGIEGTYEGP